MHSEPDELTAECRSVYADILSQAITGEFIGMQNFASLVALMETIDEKVEAVEHAESEKNHALAFQKAADELGVEVVIDLAAPYWQHRVSQLCGPGGPHGVSLDPGADAGILRGLHL